MDLKSSPVAVTSVKPINQSTKKHLRGSTLLLAGRVISLATNFFVQVLTVRYLSKSDYGAFAYALSVASLGTSLALFGLGKTITRFLPIYQEKREFQKLFGTIIMVAGTILSTGIFLVFLALSLGGWVAESFAIDPLAMKLLFLLIFLSPIDAVDYLLEGMMVVFAKPSAIFFRRHVLGPGLKLLVVLLLVLFRSDVYFLAIGYIAASTIGSIINLGIVIRNLHNLDLWKYFDIHTIKLPFREVFGFSAPLFSNDLAFLIRQLLVVVFLEYFRNTTDVATFRAVLPVAGLNTVVFQSFTFLFMPSVARMFAKQDQEGVDDIYWQSAIWITIITLPIFLVTFSLAQPFTLLLFGERYAQSGVVMAILAFGYYFNAALGFNGDTLRVYGNIRYLIAIDFIAMLVSLGLSLLLIPRFGATGAAIGTCITLVVHNILYHIGLKLFTTIDLFQWRYLRVYVSIVLGTLGLVIFQMLISPPIYIGLSLAGFLSLIVLIINRNVLNIEQTFPELLRFKLVQMFLEPNKKEYHASGE